MTFLIKPFLWIHLYLRRNRRNQNKTISKMWGMNDLKRLSFDSICNLARYFMFIEMNNLHHLLATN